MDVSITFAPQRGLLLDALRGDSESQYKFLTTRDPNFEVPSGLRLGLRKKPPELEWLRAHIAYRGPRELVARMCYAVCSHASFCSYVFTSIALN